MKRNILIVIAFVIIHTITVWIFANKMQQNCQEAIDWAIQDTSDALYTACEIRINDWNELLYNRCGLPD